MKSRTRAPGLDGVRALAVLAVIGFHEGASGLPGGFLGVDIFFVLSGFLITDLLIAGYHNGRLDLTLFWARRARRLLPALAVMLVVVTAAAAIIDPGQEASLRPALLAAGTYTSNWYQIFHRVPYFAASAQLGAPPPLDHLWSLAIEEQFYLIWPVIVLFVIVRLPRRSARAAVALVGAAASALAMALLYTPGDPSAVYYATDTHASALLIGAALAIIRPLARLTSVPAEQAKRLDAVGIAGLVVLAWAIGHVSGNDPVVYPVGLILAALGAAGLVAAAASHGVIAAITSWQPLRWVGIRSYGIYLWHWPVIALGAALAGSGSTSPWLWLLEIGVTIGLAAVSWRFIEVPILANGLRATGRQWWWVLTEAIRPVSRVRRFGPVTAAATAAIVFVVACYGVARPSAPADPSGLLRQVANGQRVSAASQSAQPRGINAARTPTPAVCHQAQAHVSGGQVTAVGDSVMLASASALNAAMPGIYIDARVGRQVEPGLSVVWDLAASARLRPIVVVGLGTNGPISIGQVRQLRQIIGPDRELILVNTYGPQPWEHESNASLSAASQHAKHTVLADWAHAIAAHRSLLWPDGIHPQPTGAKLYARVVLAAIRAGLEADQPPSCLASSGRTGTRT